MVDVYNVPEKQLLLSYTLLHSEGRVSVHWIGEEKAKIGPLEKKNGELIWEDTKALLMCLFSWSTDRDEDPLMFLRVLVDEG